MTIYNTILLSDEYATVNIVINAGVKCTFYIVKNTRLIYTDVWFTTLKFKNLSPYAGGYFTRLKANCVTSVDFYPRV